MLIILSLAPSNLNHIKKKKKKNIVRNQGFFFFSSCELLERFGSSALFRFHWEHRA